MALVSQAQKKDLECVCDPVIKTNGLDTAAVYLLDGFGFGGTVSRNRGDELREGFKLSAGMQVSPTLAWVRQLGYCGDGRFCLERVEFITNEWEPDRVRVMLYMADSRKKK